MIHRSASPRRYSRPVLSQTAVRFVRSLSRMSVTVVRSSMVRVVPSFSSIVMDMVVSLPVHTRAMVIQPPGYASTFVNRSSKLMYPPSTVFSRTTFSDASSAWIVPSASIGSI